MRLTVFTCLVLCAGIVAAIAVGPAAAKDKKAQAGQLNGTVSSINKDTSTVTVRKGNMERQIVYNANTKFLKGTQQKNTPSSIDDLKDGWYLHCWGNFDGTKLVADRCRLRGQQRTTQP